VRRRASISWNKLRPWAARAGVVVLAVASAAVVALFVLKWAPEWLAQSDLAGKDRAAEVGRTRTAILATLAGVLAAIGAYYTHRTFQLNRETYELTRETAARSHELDRAGQITERFTRAIDQLGATDDKGKPKIDIVLGGIYVLERIAKDSKDDHPQVVEVLTAYVREHARYQPDKPPAATTSSEQSQGDEPARPDEAPRPATDVQAVMTVLARRIISQDRPKHRLNLAATDLRSLNLYTQEGGHLEGADLRSAHLEAAHLAEAHLEGAVLSGAHLERADLFRAHFERWPSGPVEPLVRGANLYGAHLEEAFLGGAYLEWADLREAHLEGADLRGALLERARLNRAHLTGAHLELANLEGANLDGANLDGANLDGANLDGASLDGAIYDDKTKWPAPGESEGKGQGRAPRR
jgi:uncharacterized protein YjbI with pentapeptide repeats